MGLSQADTRRRIPQVAPAAKKNKDQLGSKWDRGVLKADYEKKIKAVRDFRAAFQKQDYFVEDAEEIKHNIV